MTEPVPLSDKWFRDMLDGFLLVPSDPDHMGAARHFAAAALRWAADEVDVWGDRFRDPNADEKNTYALRAQRECSRGHAHRLRAKADDLEKGPHTAGSPSGSQESLDE